MNKYVANFEVSCMIISIGIKLKFHHGRLLESVFKMFSLFELKLELCMCEVCVESFLRADF